MRRNLCCAPSPPCHLPLLSLFANAPHCPPLPRTPAGKFGEWRFDKRSYAGRPPPRNLAEPPAGMRNELVRHLIHSINEATAAIPGGLLEGGLGGGRWEAKE